MDTTLHDPLVGQLLDGRYRVDARIAVGGMATVYRALDTRLDRVLALKVMHSALVTDEVFVERFIREAKSVARLDHPNVVSVYDQGSDGTYVFLAMEYVEGCTLRDVLRERGALQPRVALDVLEPILAALGAAHRAGLVHRDMKPENVLIGEDGRVKVADFGLVRPVDGHTSTTTDSVLGTVSYLAPEQIEHGTADPRTDLYACGVLLYEMLTGDKPRTGGTPAQVLYQHLHQDMPAPSAVVPGLAEQLDRLVARAAARDPADRPEDAAALLSETRTLRSLLTDAQLDAAPPQAREDPQRGAEHRTSVLPRTGSAAPVEHTSRLTVPPDDGTPERPRSTGRYRRGPRWSVLVALGAVLVVLLGVGVWYINSGQFTRTPAVLDMTEREARTTLTDAGLDVRVERGHSVTVERGRVIESDPGPGDRVRGNATVTVVVSKGPDVVKVPDLSGTPLSNAKARLRSDGLKAGLVKREFDAETKQGSVIRTKPDAGARKRPGSAIALTVSKGREINVPDVVGEDRGEAREALEDAGLKVRVARKKVFSEEDEGSVAKQSPGEGSTVAKGDTVTLTVSKGQDMVPVPDVDGQSTEEAERTLEDAGFTVEVNKLFFGEEVFNQAPEAGEEAARGSEVTIWVR
ncbi:Stk1 family PASTA domain-containing Ser/Thr kinase [Streptomyces oceani]|uniref:non-specific serine/threonine protein kinase n=1 Tax=Streptomyces oceani TaxID=1075402 RepID=A0A1E7KCL1_9ACTN|nr:Stk1 family PASTA domain-containing Ser/Thr kinase [Streptomyces oceani]OEV01662.1 serine/threonine protein kinase [Streptomyces oceani]